MAVMLKEGGQHMQWYQDELLHMAKDLGLRLLPAFNTSSGLPYPRVRQLHTGRNKTKFILGIFIVSCHWESHIITFPRFCF